MAKYLGNSRLKLNDDKTHLLIMSTKQRQRVLDIRTQISTPNEEIKPIKTEKLLGIFIQNDLKWNEYLIHNEKKPYKAIDIKTKCFKNHQQSSLLQD